MLLEPTGERAQKFLKREVDHESVNRSSRLLRRTQSIPVSTLIYSYLIWLIVSSRVALYVVVPT